MNKERCISAIALPVLLLLGGDVVHARDLTFEDRVKAQEAIERVYYSHQIGTTKPFEEAVPRSVLEKKVRMYLGQSVAMERFWKTPVTAEMLNRELERIGRHTRSPDRLREIYAALGNDPILEEECLARSALVDRLTRNFFALDMRVHRDARTRAEVLRKQLLRGELDPTAEHPSRALFRLELIQEGDPGASDPADEATTRDAMPGRSPARMQQLSRLLPEEFRRQRSLLPREPGEIGQLREDREAFTVLVVLAEDVGAVEIAVYSVKKQSWDEWWSRREGGQSDSWVRSVASSMVRIPDPGLAENGGSRPHDSAVLGWETGSGAHFQPEEACRPDDTWDSGLSDEMPYGRTDHSAIWTGSVMIVWGGASGFGDVNNGARYDPATDTWTATSTSGAPSRRSGHTAVWTGTEMLVWGGASFDGYLNTGGRYDPVTDTWRTLSPALQPRSSHSAIWTGRQMIVWGGRVAGGYGVYTGGIYDPSTDTWKGTSTKNCPISRQRHDAVWSGSQMIVWGGYSAAPLNTGGRYDPVSDTWTDITSSAAPSARDYHTTIWTGSEMILWGGWSGSADLDTGARYNPVTDTWRPITMNHVPQRRSFHSAVWTGSRMIIWGGGAFYSVSGFDTGGQYDPASDSWTPTTTTNAPSPRQFHTATWTGSQMIVWGGYDQSSDPSRMNTGGRYDPVFDTWTPTVTTTAPTPRSYHTAIWTGSRMIVWGGQGAGMFRQSGGLYDPALDTWTATATLGAPSGRWEHTAIWTGSAMVVWGGRGYDYYDTGGRYDPLTNTWRPTSTAGAPSQRDWHTAVWTGERMIVWGGSGRCCGYPNTGQQYDPLADAWSPISAINAPEGRSFHTAVWTGNEMIVWGGYSQFYGYFNAGGRYDPASDTWAPMSTFNAPPERSRHAALWTGREMVVWGGKAGTSRPREAGMTQGPTPGPRLPSRELRGAGFDPPLCGQGRK